MPFNVPSYSQIRDRYLQAVVNQRPEAAIGPDSDHFVRASALAAVLEALYAHQSWGFRQAFPDLADADYMEKMAAQRGLSRKASVKAAGTLRFSGTPGVAVAAGQQVLTAQGVYYETLADGVVGGAGTVDLVAQALLVGAAGNLTINTPVTGNAPPPGVLAGASMLEMNGGADTESDEALLERLLLFLSEEAQGGNAVDYKRWALNVPGVARAFVFDNRRGIGTVDVVPIPSSGLPSGPLLAAVQAELDLRRPVGMSNIVPVLALLPTAMPVSVTAAFTLGAGVVLAGVNAQLVAAISGVFGMLAPGQNLIRAELIAALMNVDGVTDVTLTLPASNVSCLVNSGVVEIATLGALTLS